MFGNPNQSSPFDGILIDAGNERPLVIALATIIAVWAMVFAFTCALGSTPRAFAMFEARRGTALSKGN